MILWSFVEIVMTFIDYDTQSLTMISHIAKTLGSTLIRYRSHTFLSDRYLIDNYPRFFAIWDDIHLFFGMHFLTLEVPKSSNSPDASTHNVINTWLLQKNIILAWKLRVYYVLCLQGCRPSTTTQRGDFCTTRKSVLSMTEIIEKIRTFGVNIVSADIFRYPLIWRRPFLCVWHMDRTVTWCMKSAFTLSLRQLQLSFCHQRASDDAIRLSNDWNEYTYWKMSRQTENWKVTMMLISPPFLFIHFLFLFS